MGSIGGTSVGDCTRRILRHAYTNACAKELNWKGRGGKMALEGTSLTSAIISKCEHVIISCASCSIKSFYLIDLWIMKDAHKSPFSVVPEDSRLDLSCTVSLHTSGGNRLFTNLYLNSYRLYERELICLRVHLNHRNWAVVTQGLEIILMNKVW